jgi:hypothetical protein
VVAAEVEGAAERYQRYSIEPAMGDGDHDQGDEEVQPVVDSTTRCDERDAKHASVPLRRVRAGELRWEELLYKLKADPTGPGQLTGVAGVAGRKRLLEQAPDRMGVLA